MQTYSYSLTTFKNDKLATRKLQTEITAASLSQTLREITNDGETVYLLFDGVLTAEEINTLISIIGDHEGFEDSPIEPPIMPDGRPVIRADTRPLDSETYFTCSGDGVAIGDGKHLEWDFSNSDDIYTGPEVPSGFKAKQILLSFHCPVYLKDGSIYFFDAPWGCYATMDIVVPQDGYYPNPAGTIPASALGLSGNLMYAQATQNTSYQVYVNKHHMFGDCPMGDELNAEGASVNPVPPGWYVRGLIITLDTDNTSKGFASMEMYRCHTQILPGETLMSLHS